MNIMRNKHIIITLALLSLVIIAVTVLGFALKDDSNEPKESDYLWVEAATLYEGEQLEALYRTYNAEKVVFHNNGKTIEYHFAAETDPDYSKYADDIGEHYVYAVVCEPVNVNGTQVIAQNIIESSYSPEPGKAYSMDKIIEMVLRFERMFRNAHQ